MFSQFILELKEREEISCENIFIDGTKIEANANRYSFVWGKAVAKNKAKLENKAESYLAELREEYSHNGYYYLDCSHLPQCVQPLQMIFIPQVWHLSP